MLDKFGEASCAFKFYFYDMVKSFLEADIGWFLRVQKRLKWPIKVNLTGLLWMKTFLTSLRRIPMTKRRRIGRGEERRRNPRTGVDVFALRIEGAWLLTLLPPFPPSLDLQRLASLTEGFSPFRIVQDKHFSFLSPYLPCLFLRICDVADRPYPIFSMINCTFCFLLNINFYIVQNAKYLRYAVKQIFVFCTFSYG